MAGVMSGAAVKGCEALVPVLADAVPPLMETGDDPVEPVCVVPPVEPDGVEGVYAGVCVMVAGRAGGRCEMPCQTLPGILRCDSVHQCRKRPER